MCQTEGTPLGDASNKGLGPKMQNHQLSWWIFILGKIVKILNFTIFLGLKSKNNKKIIKNIFL